MARFSLTSTSVALFLAPDCSAGGNDFQCRLLSLLNLLYVLGAALGVILILVVAFAIRAWRSGRTSQEIPPPKPKQNPRHD